MNAKLVQILADTDAVLLDFDGPVCSIFAGYPAHDVAAGLVQLLHREGVQPPPNLTAERDPLQVLRWTGAATDMITTRMVEDALCEAEVRAVEAATPTPYGREVIVAARQAKLPVVVVSNNTAGAISTYLANHRLAVHIASVVGRAYADPTRMKPNPDPVLRGAQIAHAKPSRSVIIGDSVSDMVAGRAAGVRTVGYANRPSKADGLFDAGAEVVVTSMGAVAEALIMIRGATDEIPSTPSKIRPDAEHRYAATRSAHYRRGHEDADTLPANKLTELDHRVDGPADGDR